VSAAEKLAAEVTSLSKRPLVTASGFGPLLRLLVEYFGEQQRRITELETRVSMLEGVPPSVVEYAARAARER